MSEPSKSEVPYTRDEAIQIPPPGRARARAIRNIDWERCKRKIKNIEIPSQTINNISFTLVGISLSTGLNYMLIYNSEDIIPFIKAFYICITILSAIGAYVFYKLDGKNRERFKKDVKEVLIDMSEIESLFGENQTEI